MTMASSTTKPVEMVSAISDRLLRLKPSRYMAPNVPTSDSGTDRLGMMVARALRRKSEDHQHHQHDGERQLELDVRDRGADGDGAVGQHRDVDRRRQRRLQLRQQRLDAVDHLR